jgi:hypothetical protein
MESDGVIHTWVLTGPLHNASLVAAEPTPRCHRVPLGEPGNTTAVSTLTMQQWNGTHWNHRDFAMRFTRDAASSLTVPFDLVDKTVGHAGVPFQVREKGAGAAPEYCNRLFPFSRSGSSDRNTWWST